MFGYFSLWMSFGLLSPFLLDVGAVECLEKETLLKLKPNTMKKPTDCLIECSSATYEKKLQLQDNHNIRMIDSTEGELGEYCWSTELKCTIGDSFLNAYVVLPVDSSIVGNELLEVKTTSPTVTTLHAHGGATTVAESCGLLYQVTSFFSGPKTETSFFCVHVVTRENQPGDSVLPCAPYLVTFWQRNPNQSNQQGGG